jgi:septum formation protein
MKNSPSIILASASPRRRELLAAAGLDFQVVAPEVDENPLPGELPRACAERLARAKNEAVTADGIILAADTIVAQNQVILGKPADAAHAREMLRALSGAGHEVITAVCIRNAVRAVVFSVSTRVVFRTLKDDEIEDYIAGGEPMDKAGAYAIQGGAAHMVRSIHGSYTNVVGLPLCEVLECLESF